MKATKIISNYRINYLDNFRAIAILIIILGPQALAIGPIAYLIAGRNKPKGGRAPKRRILPPDDDPDFLGKL